MVIQVFSEALSSVFTYFYLFLSISEGLRLPFDIFCPSYRLRCFSFWRLKAHFSGALLHPQALGSAVSPAEHPSLSPRLNSPPSRARPTSVGREAQVVDGGFQLFVVRTYVKNVHSHLEVFSIVWHDVFKLFCLLPTYQKYVSKCFGHIQIVWKKSSRRDLVQRGLKLGSNLTF